MTPPALRRIFQRSIALTSPDDFAMTRYDEILNSNVPAGIRPVAVGIKIAVIRSGGPRASTGTTDHTQALRPLDGRQGFFFSPLSAAGTNTRGQRAGQVKIRNTNSCRGRSNRVRHEEEASMRRIEIYDTTLRDGSQGEESTSRCKTSCC